MPQNKHKNVWSSRFSYIMATTGAAVGLGNIWMFPHITGQNGGSAFVLLYLAFVLAVGIPAMIGETVLGRLGRKNPVDTLSDLSRVHKASPYWSLLGWWGAFGLLLTLAFYSVVSGWTVAYAIKTLSGSFSATTPAVVHDIWHGFLSSPLQTVLWQTFFIVITLWVVARGVKHGIEKACNFMMPALFVMLIGLMLYSCSIGDAASAFDFLFHFDASKITATVAIDALGLAFFTLAIGAGCILVYGAYMPEKTTIMSTVGIVAVLDILVALCAAMAIFPLVFAHGLQPEGGPGLMFKVLPIAFSHMPGGQWVGALFFVLLWFAAWTSTISMAEPLVLLLVEKTTLTRRWAAVVIGGVTWMLGISAALSFNLWRTMQLRGMTAFEWMTVLVTHLILPVGVLAFSIFVGWLLPKSALRQALKSLPNQIFVLWRFLIRYLVPLGVGIVLIAKVLTP
jgi:NSS family neurotransmitter:Na+ symporter